MKALPLIAMALAALGLSEIESRGQYYDSSNESTAPAYVDTVVTAVGPETFGKIDRRHALELAKLLDPIDREIVTPAAFVEHIEQAEEVRTRFYSQIDAVNFRTYLLPMRIRSEQCSSTGWRKELRHDIEPQIAGVTDIDQAAGKALNWCKSRIQITDQDRCYPLGLKGDLDPLTTLHGGSGSEVDETILSIAALRSIGIAARLVTAPVIAGEAGGKVWLEYWTRDGWHAWSPSAPAGMDSRKYLLQEFGKKFALIVANPDAPINITSTYIPVAHIQVALNGLDPQSRAGWNLLVSGKGRLFPVTGRDIYIHLSDILDVGPGDYMILAGNRNVGGMKPISIQAEETGSYVLDSSGNGTQSFEIDTNADSFASAAATSTLNPGMVREPGLW